jgi:tetratricopeptide (TPR) repeat protein
MPLLILFLTSCDPAALAIVSKAEARVEAFDLAGALEILQTAGDCDEAAGATEYLEGLQGAVEAVKQGGTVDSLRDVRSATNALSRRAETAGRRWEAASYALRAVAAASQYERAEMALYLAEALRIESLVLAAGLPGAPFISAHELAGDLQLQVHRYEDARAAYDRAVALVGPTGRARLGLALAADRLSDPRAACVQYRSFLDWWGSKPRTGDSPEVLEARSRLQALGCAR